MPAQNVANLFLARAAGRQKEIAVRSALGASRWRIIRQLLLESVLLAGIGGVAGLYLAKGALQVILVLAGDSLPRVTEIGLDGTVLLFCGALAIFTGILFGLAPAWHASRTDVQSTLKETAPGTTAARASMRHSLVVAEVALTMLLLVGAGLFLRSFYRLQKVNLGFVYERVLTFQVSLPERKYSGPTPAIAFYQQLLEKLCALSGVKAASVTSRLPLETGAWDTTFLVEGQPIPAPHERPSMDVQLAGPDYFRAMGIPILQGRPFSDLDNRSNCREQDGRRNGAGR